MFIYTNLEHPINSTMLKTELETRDLLELKELYRTENEKLQALLLDGMPWDELTEQRKMVIMLGSVIDAKQAIKNRFH